MSHPSTTGPAPEAPAVRLVVLAKAPRPGRVKTRLCPPFTPAEAADLAAAALADTLDAVLAAVATDDRLSPVLVLDGPAGPWVPAGLAVLPQRGDGLDERLAAAFEDAGGPDTPVLLVGMDTPQLTAGLLVAAAEVLIGPGVDAVLGRAVDGGWWGLGLRRPRADLLLGVPMSTAHTGARQQERLWAAGLHVRPLPVMRDVDTAADAAEVARAAPGTAFARTFTALTALDARA